MVHRNHWFEFLRERVVVTLELALVLPEVGSDELLVLA